ncbi:exonuclease [Sulfitobacter sp. HNIBRBA3233]|uniref:exonuclease n=1 Tax=Sulfitobacter marinivivus TaxID=3158558 RepID=UPI0032DF26C0
MDFVTVYDCEFLTAPGAPARFWCGPDDPDPLCVQIGAVHLSLGAPFAVSDPVGWYVSPRDRDGQIAPVDPLLTRLCGITDAQLQAEGLALADALAALSDFARGSLLLGWGKDELLTFAPSLFVQGLTSPIPAAQFRNAPPLLVTAGEDLETVHRLRSNTICGHFGLDAPGPAHDARADAAAVATALSHLLNTGRLSAADITGLAPT